MRSGGPFARPNEILMPAHATISDRCFAVLSLVVTMTVTAAAEVTLSASASVGDAVVRPGGRFDVELTWGGAPVIAAADYAVVLNTSRVMLIGREFDAALGPFADTPFLAAGPLATRRLDVTWFRPTGGTGRDLTLHFQVPADYTGPATFTIGLVDAVAEDHAGTGIPVLTVGTTVKIQPVVPAAYAAWALAAGLAAADQAPELDPDRDGLNNLAEFAFYGDPLSGGQRWFIVERKDTAADPDDAPELTLTCAMRRGAVFAAQPDQSQVSEAIDGLSYTVAASSDLKESESSDRAVHRVSAADTPPTGSGLPDLTGTDWEYQTFSAFNGLPDHGFLQATAVMGSVPAN